MPGSKSSSQRLWRAVPPALHPVLRTPLVTTHSALRTQVSGGKTHLLTSTLHGAAHQGGYGLTPAAFSLLLLPPYSAQPKVWVFLPPRA